MRILFTGSSSFTGYWFIRELAAAGHEVIATLQSSPDKYAGIRRRRVDALGSACNLIPNCSFGDDKFLEIIASQGQWDLLCHHAADSRNYKSPKFDVLVALETNAHKAEAMLAAMRERGCDKMMLTGSYFENDEGAGSDDRPAFSSYGVSKALTAQLFRYYCATEHMSLGKFVIPNPFGPYEEPRFTAYLMRCWLAGKVAAVNTPAYIRDNIHVSLLAKCYARFVQDLQGDSGFTRTNPSGYVSSQGDFARRFAEEMRTRLNLPCLLELKSQTEFPEPHARTNTDAVCSSLDWDEAEAWDSIAEFYQQLDPAS